MSRRQVEQLQDRSELQMQLILSLGAWLVPVRHRRQPDRRSSTALGRETTPMVLRRFMHERDLFCEPAVCVLSGPAHAEPEVAQNRDLPRLSWRSARHLNLPHSCQRSPCCLVQAASSAEASAVWTWIVYTRGQRLWSSVPAACQAACEMRLTSLTAAPSLDTLGRPRTQLIPAASPWATDAHGHGRLG